MRSLGKYPVGANDGLMEKTRIGTHDNHPVARTGAIDWICISSVALPIRLVLAMFLGWCERQVVDSRRRLDRISCRYM